MGRKESKGHKQAQRVIDELNRALEKGDGKLALDRFLVLSDETRASWRAPIASLVGEGLEKDFRAQRWSDVMFWAARIRRDALLLDELDERRRLSARWALLWGSISSRQWVEASRHLDLLGRTLAAPWKEAIETLVLSEGRVAPEDMPSLEAVVSLTKLGQKPARRSTPKKAPASPASSEEVRPAMLVAYRTLPWPQFVETISQWTRVLEPSLAQPIRILAAELAVEQLLTEKRRRNATDPALFIATMTDQAGAPLELENTLSLALRLSTDSVDDENHELAPIAPLLAIAPVAARYERLQPILAVLFCGPVWCCETTIPVIAMLEAIARHLRSADLTLLGFLLVKVAETSVPPWLIAKLEELVRMPGELDRAIVGFESEEIRMVIDSVCEGASPELAADAIDAMWQDVPAKVSRELNLGLVRVLLDARARATRNTPVDAGPLMAALVKAIGRPLPDSFPWQRVLEDPSFGSMARVISGAALEQRGEPLPDSVRPLWHRFMRRAVPECVEMLDRGLAYAASEEEREEVLSVFVTANMRPTHWVGAWDEARRHKLARSAKALEGWIMNEWAHDAAAAGKGFMHAVQQAFPKAIRIKLANLLLSAVEKGKGALGSEVAEAMIMARVLLFGRDKKIQPKPNRPKYPANKKPGKPKAKKQNRADQQLLLGLS